MSLLVDSPVKERDYTRDEIDDVLQALKLRLTAKTCTDRERAKIMLRVDYWLDKRLELNGS